MELGEGDAARDRDRAERGGGVEVAPVDVPDGEVGLVVTPANNNSIYEYHLHLVFQIPKKQGKHNKYIYIFIKTEWKTLNKPSDQCTTSRKTNYVNCITAYFENKVSRNEVRLICA